MANQIHFGKTVSLSEAENLLINVRSNRFHLRGEPGIGKSSMAKRIGERTGLPVAYIDVPNMDLGDIAMPVIDHATKTTKYYPNARFLLDADNPRPVVIMLDEFTKGADPVKNMLHPLLEVANPRLGDISIHPDSIIFTTGNLSGDGVGDNMKAHTRARLDVLTVRKPNADEWLEWANNSGRIAPEIMAYVNRFPHVLASYIDGDHKDNPYIYNPRAQQDGYICPRTLELASNVVNARASLTPDSTIAALSGVIGEAGARDMQAFIAYADQLPTWESITATPETAKVPDQPGACAVLVYGAVSKTTKDTMSAFMKYISRFSAEWQAAFAITISKTTSKQAIAFGNREFSKWVADNQDLL